jgi:hypothetical protein
MFKTIIKAIAVGIAKLMCMMAGGSCKVVYYSAKGALKVGGDRVTRLAK